MPPSPADRSHVTPPPQARQSGIRVLVVDDHPLFRRGFVEALRDEADLRVCGEANSIAAALAAVAVEEPDVAVIDLTLGEEDGLDLVATLRRTRPQVRLLVLSGHDERVHADRALKAGALGYVMKGMATADLVAATRRVAAGKTWVSRDTAERILSTLGTGPPTSRSPLDRLSDRERRVLTLLGRGMTTREIAVTLGLAVKTVETYYANLKGKLGLHNGRELMRVAVTWAEDDHV